MNLMKVDFNELTETARWFFEVSDIYALNDLFGSCKSIEDINGLAEEYKKEGWME